MEIIASTFVAMKKRVGIAMTRDKLEELAKKLASVATLDSHLLAEIVRTLRPRFPAIAIDHKGDEITEAALHLVD